MSESQSHHSIESNTLPIVADSQAIDEAIKNLKEQNFIVLCFIFLGLLFFIGLFALLWNMPRGGGYTGRTDPLGYLIVPIFYFPLMLPFTLPVMDWNNKIIRALKKDKPDPSYSISLRKNEKGTLFVSYKKMSTESKDSNDSSNDSNDSKNHQEIELAGNSCSDIAMETDYDASIFFEKWGGKPLAILLGQTVLIVAFQYPK